MRVPRQQPLEELGVGCLRNFTDSFGRCLQFGTRHGRENFAGDIARFAEEEKRRAGIVQHERGVGFCSLQESIDTTTSGGKLVFHVFGALAEFERDIIRDRTQAGLAAARERGRRGGRPKSLDAKKLAFMRSLYADPANKPKDICDTLRISRATLYRCLDATNLRPRAVQDATNDAVPEVAPIMRALGKPATNTERAESRQRLLKAAGTFGMPLMLGSELAPPAIDTPNATCQ
jgi:hypothetical protein